MPHRIIHTGQHYDYSLSQAFFDDLKLPTPHHYLGVKASTPGAQIGRMIEGLEAILREQGPEQSVVIVYGDTNSTLAGALAAVNVHIPVVHVEAGLRSFDRSMPEEINRILVDHISAGLFAPSAASIDNLANEGIKNSVHPVGDVNVEVLKTVIGRAEKSSRILKDLGLEGKKYYLATIHRQSNTDSKMNLLWVISELGKMELPVIFPIHPRTAEKIDRFGLHSQIQVGNVNLVEPLNFTDFVKLILHSEAVITDSGGVQKEAFLCRKPCITIRANTEWVETLELKANILVPPRSDIPICDVIRKVMEKSPNWYAKPYGDGNAAEKIVSILEDRV